MPNSAAAGYNSGIHGQTVMTSVLLVAVKLALHCSLDLTASLFLLFVLPFPSVLR